MVENHASDAVSQDGDVEVDQKTDGPASEPQIGQQLRFVDRPERIDRLELENDGPFHDEIETVPAIQPYAFVGDG
jgi:hypothetical protein